ncbi:gas vesicle protein GVPa [Thalassoporum mexicanum PCC 7367]|uniref:gas vesicle protein n=1 Tax=Thalassoporum mexicanum TaxID=3457544 RepID=UPI00029FAA49|nr:gas vesicle protein [Pseudanabaena sp. PCC 7367]AFY69108.1 gas vesicle protein GVPa [Pseudanabaena sp. PCC 7367]
MAKPPTSVGGSTLADILERVLDKGIVIAGDITVSIGDVELLSIRIRLLVASVDKAKEIGINWWESDPYLSTRAQELMMVNQKLLERVSNLEQELLLLKGAEDEKAALPKNRQTK